MENLDQRFEVMKDQMGEISKTGPVFKLNYTCSEAVIMIRVLL